MRHVCITRYFAGTCKPRTLIEGGRSVTLYILSRHVKNDYQKMKRNEKKYRVVLFVIWFFVLPTNPAIMLCFVRRFIINHHPPGTVAV